MSKQYVFQKYPEAFRIVYQNLGIQPKKKYLTDTEASRLLRSEVVLEEKLDGSTLFVTWTGGKPLLRAKGARIISEFEKTKAFVHAYNWAYQNSKRLEKIPRGHAIVGEWMYAMHSIPYNELPDFFVAFDVIEMRSGKILPLERKMRIIEDCGLFASPILYVGKTNYDEIPDFIRTSKFSAAHPMHEPPFDAAQTMEGIVVKSYGQEFNSGKYVTREFSDAMEMHWLKKPLIKNRLKNWGKPIIV